MRGAEKRVFDHSTESDDGRSMDPFPESPTWETNLRESVVGTRMNTEKASFFDLSPSEKLQLVEDLWDDLAATPEAVPVHE